MRRSSCCRRRCCATTWTDRWRATWSSAASWARRAALPTWRARSRRTVCAAAVERARSASAIAESSASRRCIECSVVWGVCDKQAAKGLFHTRRKLHIVKVVGDLESLVRLLAADPLLARQKAFHAPDVVYSSVHRPNQTRPPIGSIYCCLDVLLYVLWYLVGRTHLANGLRVVLLQCIQGGQESLLLRLQCLVLFQQLGAMLLGIRTGANRQRCRACPPWPWQSPPPASPSPPWQSRRSGEACPACASSIHHVEVETEPERRTGRERSRTTSCSQPFPG